MPDINHRKTHRNKEIAAITAKLNTLLPLVLHDTGIKSQQSLHGIIGGKNASFIDLHTEIISSPEMYLSLWAKGYKKRLKEIAAADPNFKTRADYRNYVQIVKSRALRAYLQLFLKRTFLRNYESLSRNRPSLERSEVWIGSNNADYGLLITPRFNPQLGWENDKSEIRHFTQQYWTIGHVVETGLVVPGKPDKISFNSATDYLSFFKNVLVRESGSIHENKIAELYSTYVESHATPGRIPLLIPQIRYRGKEKNHKYRLDFCIIDPIDDNRVGFEISPSSSHFHISEAKKKLQKEINSEIAQKIEASFKKSNEYFQTHGIHIQSYTHQMLDDIDKVFDEIKSYLTPNSIARQIELSFEAELFNFVL